MKILHVILCVIAMQCQVAAAALQSVHWKTEGDGQVTLDTATGIEWLDLTLTRGKSIDEVSALLTTTYAGWRLPTVTEMRTLMFAIYGRTIYGDLEYVNSVWAPGADIAKHFMMGNTENQSVTGYYLNTGGVYAFLSTGYASQGNGYYYFNHYRSVTTSYKTENGGVYLVSDGGASWSSLNDPSININNPNAPVNQLPVAPVSTSGLFGCALLLLLRKASLFCRKSKSGGAV